MANEGYPIYICLQHSYNLLLQKDLKYDIYLGATLMRDRLLSDLDDLTLGDIDDYTLKTLDVIPRA